MDIKNLEEKTVIRAPWLDFLPPPGNGWVQISRQLTNEMIPFCDIRTTWTRFSPLEGRTANDK